MQIAVGAHISFKTFSFDKPTLIRKPHPAQETAIQMLSHIMLRTRILEYKMHGMIRYTANMSFDPNFVYKTLEGIGAGIGKAADGIGLAFVHFANGSMHNIADATTTILKGPFQVLVNIAATVAGFLFLALLLYLFFRYYLLKRCPFRFWRSRRPDNNPDQMTPDTVSPPDQSTSTELQEIFMHNPLLALPAPSSAQPLALPPSNSNALQPSNLIATNPLTSTQWEPAWNQPLSPHHPSFTKILLEALAQKQHRNWTPTANRSDIVMQVILEESVETHDTPWSLVPVNGKPGALVRWDTAASHSIIAKSAYDILAAEGLAYPLHKTNRVPLSANGTTLPVLGVTVLDLTLGDHKASTAALVVENLP